jgi:hypothetical protein
MVVVPALTPVTLPEPSIDPFDGVLLAQEPPDVASLSNFVIPTHSDDTPWMGNGSGLTVAVCVAEQLPIV